MDHFLHVMRDQDNGYFFLTVQFPHSLQNFFPSVGVQHGGWLIQNDTSRTHGHHTGNGYTLFLSSGKFVW